MLGAGRGPFRCLPQGPFGVAGLLNEGIGLTGVRPLSLYIL